MHKFIETLKNKEVRKRILFTLLVFALYRYGCTLTVPGVDKTTFSITSDSMFAIMNMMGGGALSRFSVFALGVSPYITAGIIIQLLSMDVVPCLSDWRKDGERGRKKTEKVTRYLTLILAVVQGLSITYGFDKQYGILGTDAGVKTYIFIVMMLVTGTMLITWLGDQITIHGIGNGMSMLIFAGIISELPSTFFMNFYNTVLAAVGTNNLAQGIIHFAGFALLYLLLIFVVTFIECGERRIPIKNATSSFSGGGNMSYFPIKVNPAGVIPVIFAQSLITAPQIIISFFNQGLYQKLNTALSLKTPLGLSLYAFLTFVFTFIYTDMMIDPEEVADNLKKSGTFFINVRPGKDTAKYLHNVCYRTALIGAIVLTVIALLPYVLAMFATVTSTTALGGTGIIVCVGVAMETLEAIKTMQIEHKYENGWL